MTRPKPHPPHPEPPLLVDAHVDLPYFMQSHAPDLPLPSLSSGPFTLEKAKGAGVRLFVTALYCEDRYNGEKAVRRMEQILRFTRDRFRGVPLVQDGTDLQAVEKDSSFMGTFFLLENADSLAGGPTLADELKEKGIHAVGLTHAGRNRLGDGNAVLHSDGLSSTGIGVVRALEENHIPIDIAHLHARCFRQLLDAYRGPIFTSHTGIRSVFDSPRNIDLDQAREILSRGGMIGVSFNPEMLSPERSAGVRDAFSHLDTLVQKFGPLGVGIGSDFCGFDASEGELSDLKSFSLLQEIMGEHGYPAADIRGIMGLNWMRFFRNYLFRA